LASLQHDLSLSRLLCRLFIIEFKREPKMPSTCARFPLLRPLRVAYAQDTYLKPTWPFPDNENLPGIIAPKYGQDITSAYGRIAPGKQTVGSTPAVLKLKMRKLLQIFAGGDKSEMATRLFDAFLTDNCRQVAYFEDAALNAAANSHPNIEVFCNAALSAPNSPHKSVGKTRIHQALKKANWDITKIYIPTDLGVPAFNLGSKIRPTEDFNNGLGLMINGVQYVFVMATHYHYDKEAKSYCITLKYIFYDVFGLDDDDLREFGASSDSILSSNAAIGITAWWQLQHQHGYTPLVTRIVVERTYESPAE
jgi:hypothetical protein